MKQLQNCKAAIGIAMMLSAAFAHGQQPLLTGDSQINSAATTNYGASTALTVNSASSALMIFNLSDMHVMVCSPLRAETGIVQNARATRAYAGSRRGLFFWSEFKNTNGTRHD